MIFFLKLLVVWFPDRFQPIDGIQPGQVKPCPYDLVWDNREGRSSPAHTFQACGFGLWKGCWEPVWWVGGDMVLRQSGALMVIIRDRPCPLTAFNLDRSSPLAAFNQDRSSPVPTVWFGIIGRAGPARPIHVRLVGLVCRNDPEASLMGWWWICFGIFWGNDGNYPGQFQPIDGIQPGQVKPCPYSSVWDYQEGRSSPAHTGQACGVGL